MAMEAYKAIGEQLIDKLIAETDQPEKDEIEKGHYYEIQDADLLDGDESLSGDWCFHVHGEHCMFENQLTGQTLEISLGSKESIANLDPYFFYGFLKTTDNFRNLTEYFEKPFSDMCDFFEEMERQKKMIQVNGAYRKR